MTTGPQWHFLKTKPGDRSRNSQVEKFFKSDAVEDRASALVREGIQNSLDAIHRDKDSKTTELNVRIGLGRVSAENMVPFSSKLLDHIRAVPTGKLDDPPNDSEAVSFLTFEDFNTTGLFGDPKEWEPPEEGKKNPFFNFFRGEGVSDKSGTARGRHGVGKMVFSIASRARGILALTNTNEGRSLLMGTATLPQHRLDKVSYHPDGWFGILETVPEGELVVPITEGSIIDSFKDLFQLHRDIVTGLSIVVPWVDTESCTAGKLVRSVIGGFYWPIINKTLNVDVNGGTSAEDIRVRSENLESLIESDACEASLDEKKRMKADIALARWGYQQSAEGMLSAEEPEVQAPHWAPEKLSEEVKTRIRTQLESGEPIALRVPIAIRFKEAKKQVMSEFRIFLTKDSNCGDGAVQFIREGLIISDVRPPRFSGYRGLVVIEEGPLGSFLGDAENPSHTQWQKENLKAKYSYHDACLKYVIESVPKVLRFVNESQKEADPTLLVDLFYLQKPKVDVVEDNAKKPKSKGGGESKGFDGIKAAAKPKSYFIGKVSNGFTIKEGDAAATQPKSVEIRAAYGVRKGNPLKKYRYADFDLAKNPIEVVATGVTNLIKEKNVITFDVVDSNFDIKVTGFDTNRDLHLFTKAIYPETEDANGSTT